MENDTVTTDDLAVMVKKGFDGVTKDIKEVKDRLTNVESSMVTKTYLDEKLAKLSGNLVTLVRKEDKKVNILIDTLHGKSVLDDHDVKQIQEIEVFPFAPKA